MVGGSHEVLRCVVLGGYKDGEGLLGCYEDGGAAASFVLRWICCLWF